MRWFNSSTGTLVCNNCTYRWYPTISISSQGASGRRLTIQSVWEHRWCLEKKSRAAKSGEGSLSCQDQSQMYPLGSLRKKDKHVDGILYIPSRHAGSLKGPSVLWVCGFYFRKIFEMFASLRKNTWIKECKNGRSAIHIQNMLYTVESRRMKSWSPKRLLKNTEKTLQAPK